MGLDRARATRHHQMATLTPLEDQVIRMLLAGDDEALAVLRQQVDHAKVSSRRMKNWTNDREESENNHEEEEERLEGRKRRKLSLSADGCENQGAE